MVFTLSASPAPSADLTVNVDVSQQGDYGVSTGSQTVTIGTSGTATLTVATAGDDVDEADGSVTVTLVAGSGYTVSASNGAATVAVADDDAPALFVPDAQLVADVTAKADAHSNPAAAERLRKIVKGMKGEDGGYTAAECRRVADDHGVTGTWTPWCDEIERRENWTPSVSRQSRFLRALLDAVADEAERIRQVLGYEVFVAGEVLDLDDLEEGDLSDLGMARHLIPPEQRIEIRCCYDEGDEFAGMPFPWMRMILLEDDDFQSRHIIMHELYHLLGFTHAGESPGVVMSDALMYGPGTDAPTQPSPLDLARLACIYD